MRRLRRWLGNVDIEIFAFAVTVVCLVGLARVGVGADVLAVVGGLAAMGGAAARLGFVRQLLSPPVRDDAVDVVMDLLTSRQLAFWWDEATRRGIIDPDHAGGAVWSGGGGLFPASAAWPRGWPRASAPAEPLTAADATLLVEQLIADRPRLTVIGPGGAGKTSAMLAVFLQALRRRADAPPGSAAADAPVPVWVSLAGWDPFDVSLRQWVITSVHRDYPGILRSRRELGSDPLGALWEADRPRGGRLMLFLDGLDELGGPDGEGPGAADAVGRALAAVDGATRGTAVMVTCREDPYARAVESPEYTAPHVPARAKTAVLAIRACTLSQARDFLLDGTTGEERSRWIRFMDALDARGDDLREVWNNPLSLSLIRSGYHGINRDPNRLLAELPAAGFVPGRTVLGPLLDNLFRANYPDPADRAHAERWLTWIVERTEGREFAWWHIPAWLSPPERTALLRLRARRAAGTAMRVFAGGALVLACAAAAGVVTGFDRADLGSSGRSGLAWRDVVSWPWPWVWGTTELPLGNRLQVAAWTVLANPFLLILALAGLTYGLVWLMVRVGGELEHPDGGQPQAIDPSVPRSETLRHLPEVTGWKPLLIVVAALAGAAVLARTRPEGAVTVAVRALMPGLVLASVFLLAVVLLHWWSRPARAFAPWTAYADDRQTTRVITVLVGAILVTSSAVLTWWLSIGREAPSLGQWLWLLTATSIAAGATRGVHLGAGLGAPSFLRLRPRFGAGYAARLALAQEVLRRRHPTAPGARPLDFCRLLDLTRSDAGTEGLARPVLGMMRLVGARYELRHPTLRDHLLARRPPPGPEDTPPPEPAPARAASGRRAYGAVGVSVAALVLVSTITGVGSFLSTRAPCAHRPGFWPSTEPTVWLENGQCVGVIVPVDATNWFSPPGEPTARNEQRLVDALDRIAANNRAVADVPASDVRTIVFFSPLSRTPGQPDQQTINGLAQLEGAARAQADLNRHAGGPRVRLAVANSGNQFAAGESVVRAVNRLPGLSAVIGISQSRSVTRAALNQLPDRIPIVAASVNGTRMRDGGLGGDAVPPLEAFESVAPDDGDVADALVTSLRADRPPFAKAVIVSDSDDIYYADELRADVRNRLAARGPLAVDEVELRERPRGDDDAAAGVAAALCREERRTAVLFTGRADQLTSLVHTMEARAHRSSCPLATGPGLTVIAGPGALVALAEGELDPAEHPWLTLRYYSLVAGRPGTPVRDTAIDSDRATGYTALRHAYVRVTGLGGAALPAPAAENAALELRTRIDPADGHNLGTPIFLCRTDGRCDEHGQPTSRR